MLLSDLHGACNDGMLGAENLPSVEIVVEFLSWPGRVVGAIVLDQED
jgi:hypothetical protein